MWQFTRIVSGLSDYSHHIMYAYILDQESPVESDLMNLMIFSHSLSPLSLFLLSASKCTLSMLENIVVSFRPIVQALSAKNLND